MLRENSHKSQNDREKHDLGKKKDIPFPEEQINTDMPQDELHKVIHLSGMYKDWFLDYASYVILERAVPHVNDGLKPVQRRILHAMKRLDDGRYNKVANIIGLRHATGRPQLLDRDGHELAERICVSRGQRRPRRVVVLELTKHYPPPCLGVIVCTKKWSYLDDSSNRKTRLR